MKPDFVEKIKAFMDSQKMAEEQGDQEFVCPICGGSAKWRRAPENNHLHCACGRCGMRMME